MLLKKTLLFFCIYACFSCKQDHKIEILFNWNQNTDSIKILDHNNNNLTKSKELGINKVDSLKCLSLKGRGDKLIRKFVKDKDTMLLYFSPKNLENNKTVFTIENLTFKRGKFLINNEYSFNIPSMEHFADYYNEYLNLVLKDKKENSSFKATENYIEFNKMRKKLYKTDYDYRQINFYDIFNSKEEGKKQIIYSDTVTQNNRKLFWEFKYIPHETASEKYYKKNPDKFLKTKDVFEVNGYSHGLVSGYSLVDTEKQEYVATYVPYTDLSVSLKDLKDGYTIENKFIDANFDNKKDLLIGYAERNLYLYNDNLKNYSFFKSFNDILIDSINKKVTLKTRTPNYTHDSIKKTYTFKKGKLDTVFQEKISYQLVNKKIHRISSRQKFINSLSVYKTEKKDTTEIKQSNPYYDSYKKYISWTNKHHQ